jgi:hypothetical protein
MKASRIPAWILVTILLPACVERFYPDEDDVVTGNLVVNAHLSDKPGIQSIQVSRSDKLYYSRYIPEAGCIVQVENQLGEVASFTEEETGTYSGSLDASFLQTGFQYRLRLVTADGTQYESEYTTLHPATSIDSVYYGLETRPTSDPETELLGLGFYMDVELDPAQSAFIRWEMIETYEFRNPDYQGYIYDVDRVLRPLPDSMSDRQCWITEMVNSILTLDAGNLAPGLYTRMPLQFVSNETQRLKYRYSLFVRQYSMDESAFRYWDELKKNVQENSGVYSRQPTLTPSNICNCSDPMEKVLGYFSISGVSELRIFVEEVPGLEVPDRLFCFPTFEPPRLRWLLPQDLPIFLSEAKNPIDGVTYFGETPQYCLDCRLRRGSSGEPPDYWQNK